MNYMVLHEALHRISLIITHVLHDSLHKVLHGPLHNELHVYYPRVLVELSGTAWQMAGERPKKNWLLTVPNQRSSLLKLF